MTRHSRRGDTSSFPSKRARILSWRTGMPRLLRSRTEQRAKIPVKVLCVTHGAEDAANENAIGFAADRRRGRHGVPQPSSADEGGVSFWIPASSGASRRLLCSRAGRSDQLLSHQRICRSRRVAGARDHDRQNPRQSQREPEREPRSRADLGWALPTYTFATPVFGGQASVGALGMYGRVSTSLAGTLAGTLTTPMGTIPFHVPTASATRSGVSET